MQRIEHLLFAGFVEFQCLSPRGRPAGKRLERLVPLLQVLEFLAERVLQESRRLRGPVALLDECAQRVYVLVVLRLAQPRQYPVRMRIARIDIEGTFKALLGRIEIAPIHLVIGVVDEEHRVVRAFLCGVRKPAGCFVLVTLL